MTFFGRARRVRDGGPCPLYRDRRNWSRSSNCSGGPHSPSGPSGCLNRTSTCRRLAARLPPAGRGELDAAAVKRGRQGFVQLECVRCHHPPEYTPTLNHDVGLRDQAGLRHFNPPSLRGVGQRPAYFPGCVVAATL